MSEDAAGAKRIFVYGVAGSGKSTLARGIAAALGLPYTAVDELTWNPGWTFVDFDEQRKIFREICAQDEWVLDNAYGHWIDIPLERVELIVALDYTRWFSFRRLFRRTIHAVRKRTKMCNGNVETWGRILSPKSILLWHVTTFGRKRKRIREWEREGRPLLVLKTPKEAERWLRELGDDRAIR